MCSQSAEVPGELAKVPTWPFWNHVMTSVYCISRSLPFKKQETACRQMQGRILSLYIIRACVSLLSWLSSYEWACGVGVMVHCLLPHLVLTAPQYFLKPRVPYLWQCWSCGFGTTSSWDDTSLYATFNFFWPRAWRQYFLVNRSAVYIS